MYWRAIQPWSRFRCLMSLTAGLVCEPSLNCFRKVVESLGCGIRLKEVGDWGVVLRYIVILTKCPLLPVLSHSSSMEI